MAAKLWHQEQSLAGHFYCIGIQKYGANRKWGKAIKFRDLPPVTQGGSTSQVSHNLQNNTTSRGPGVQTHEPMGSFQIQTVIAVFQRVPFV